MLMRAMRRKVGFAALTPPYLLRKVWPKGELVISPASGHSAFEPENVDALIRATDKFAA